MSRESRLISFAMLLVFWLNGALAQEVADDNSGEIDEQKLKQIETLLKQSGQSNEATAQQFIDLFLGQMTVMLRQANPNLDARAIELVEEEIVEVVAEKFLTEGAMLTIAAPLYDRYFSVDELEQMIAFNDSELGQKILRVMPFITQESMQAGAQLGQSLGPEIARRIEERLKEEGIELIN
ncbi:MAG: DUF2059 domain-containing protein [Pseudomonadota bacterium]